MSQLNVTAIFSRGVLHLIFEAADFNDCQGTEPTLLAQQHQIYFFLHLLTPSTHYVYSIQCSLTRAQKRIRF